MKVNAYAIIRVVPVSFCSMTFSHLKLVSYSRRKCSCRRKCREAKIANKGRCEKFSKNIVVFVCTSASWMWSVNWKVQSTQARSIRSNKKFDLIRENINPWERS